MITSVYVYFLFQFWRWTYYIQLLFFENVCLLILSLQTVIPKNTPTLCSSRQFYKEQSFFHFFFKIKIGKEGVLYWKIVKILETKKILKIFFPFTNFSLKNIWTFSQFCNWQSFQFSDDIIRLLPLSQPS